MSTPSESSASFTGFVEVNTAPHVEVLPVQQRMEDPTLREVPYNPRYGALWDPIQGPLAPYATPESLSLGRNNCPNGFVQATNVNDFVFDQQFHTFHNYGYAIDPARPLTSDGNGLNYIGNPESIQRHQGATVYSSTPKKKRVKKRSAPSGDPGSETYLGPWAPFASDRPSAQATEEQPAETEVESAPTKKRKVGEGEEEKESIATTTAAEGGEKPSEEGGDIGVPSTTEVAERTKTMQAEDDVIDETEQTEHKEQEVEEEDEGAEQETTIFHGKEFRDYQGRTYLSPPSTLRDMPHETFLPKKLIHTWKGHNKGVNAVRFFPKWGHLLLSAGMDGKLKLWDVYNDRNCLRTFLGHKKAVRDICFSKDGRTFLSCSYDRYIKLWDTETGQCLGRYTNRKIPYCVKFHPSEGRQREFVVGCSDKRIIQWNIDSGKIVQKYDQHLGAVNTITFIDDGRRFVTSSDDKTLRVWEWGIPVVIKYISEPHMHSMPSVTLSPDGQWLLAQSLDNQILVYSTKDKFRINKKKRFMGHVVAGFASQVSCSTDGKFVMSGDSSGKLWIWDWKTARMLRKMDAHDRVCIGCEWHPIEPSRLVTCGWDAKIKFWD